MVETSDPGELLRQSGFQPMPDLHPDEYEALKEGIQKNGIQNAVHIDDQGRVIDGHHRVEIADELGIEVPVKIHEGLTEDEKISLAWELNMQQRHLEEHDKKTLIEERLKQLDEQGIPKTNKAVSNELGVDDSWVAEIRRRLADAGEIGGGPEISTLPQQQKRDAIEEYSERHPNESDRSVARALGVHHSTVGSVRDKGDRKTVEWNEGMTGERMFPYVGSKYNIARWLGLRLPQHRTYVEPFGGSAALLYTKPRSEQEVYNDNDEDFAHFFRTLQTDSEEIEEVLADVEFTREQHEIWTRHWYEGWRPSLRPESDSLPGPDARRAAVFFFARYSQYNNKYRTYSGFNHPRSNPDNAAEYRAHKTRLSAFAERLEDVRVEEADYMEVLAKYDSPDTLFYLDPPYVGKEEYYGEFTHEWLVEIVNSLEGEFILSYGEKVPDGLEHLRRVKMTNIPGDRSDIEHHFFSFPETQEEEFVFGREGWMEGGDAMRSDW